MGRKHFRKASAKACMLAVAVAVLKMSPSAHSQVVTYTPLDLIIKRQSLLKPYGLNDNDQVVGYTYSNSNSNSQLPFIYTPSTTGSTRAAQLSNGTFTTVPGLVASSSSIGMGINNAGVIVGVDGTTNNGFIYTPGASSATLVSPLNSGGSLSLSKINSSGIAIGTSTTAAGLNTAVIYNSSNATLTDVGGGFTASANSSYGVAINDAGTALAIGAPPASVNSYGNHFEPFTVKSAAGGTFTYTNVGNAVETALQPGNYPAYGSATPGMGITPSGDVAGTYGYSSLNSYKPFLNNMNGFIFNGSSGSVSNIGIYGSIDAVNTVNGSTQVGGTAYVYNPQTFGHEFDAFVQINGNFVNLSTAVPGYTLSDVIAINSKGDLIASGFNNSTGSANTRYLLLVANPIPSLAWTGGVSNVWNTTAANFTPSNYADGNYVTFDDSATGSTAISIASVVSPGGVTFNNASKNYVINGAGITGGASVGLTLKGSGAVTLNNSNTFTGPTTLNAGTLTVGSTGTLASNTLFLSRNTSVVVQNGGKINSSGLTLTVNPNSTLTFAPTTATTPAGKLALQLNSFTNYGGTLDLGNSDLIAHNATSSSYFSYIAYKFNSGIISSVARSASNGLYALGEIQNSTDQTTSGSALYSTFDGVAVTNTDVLVKYTYYGDANLDGKVDGSDYSLIDNAFINEQYDETLAAGWYNGDFNYDGTVNGSDYTLIDNAFNTQGAALPSAIVSTTAQIASTSTAVPEPSIVGAMGVVLLAGFQRRRSSHGTVAQR